MFQTVKEYEQDPEASKAERDLITACREGTVLVVNGGALPELGNADPDIIVRAALIRLLILQATSLHETGVHMVGGLITGTLDLRFGKCRGPLSLINCRFVKTLQLAQVELAQLSLQGSHFPGLSAPEAKVAGSIFLVGVTATKTVDFRMAQIGGQLNCADATLNSDKAAALNAQGAKVSHQVDLENVTANGVVDFVGAEIGSQFKCVGTTLKGGSGMALSAQSMLVGGGFVFQKIKAISGRVNLQAAQVRDLVDDAASWGKCSDVLLDGFTYVRISGDMSPKSFAQRKNWLDQGSRFKEEFLPQPYTQFAKVVRDAGHAAEARKTLMERDTILFQEAETTDREAFLAAYQYGVPAKGVSGKIWVRLQGRRLWSSLSRRVIGHGHHPEYALFWALGAVALGSLWFFLAYAAGVMVPNSDVIMTSADWLTAMKPTPDAPTLAWSELPSAKHYETFYPFPYALDVFVPFLSLGQEQAWAATTVTWFGWVTRCMTFAYQIAGWVVTSLGIAAITGFVQRNAPD